MINLHLNLIKNLKFTLVIILDNKFSILSNFWLEFNDDNLKFSQAFFDKNVLIFDYQ